MIKFNVRNSKAQQKLDRIMKMMGANASNSEKSEESTAKTESQKDNRDEKTKDNEQRIINLIIVDESGSMSAIYHEALSGMNETIQSIQAKAEAIKGVEQYINLITFDTEHYKQHLRHCPAKKAHTLSTADYRPGGGTPLYDAIGRAVTTLERHITDNDAVVVTIITDGMENASREFSANEIRRLIERLSENGWLFTFIGANQDVMLEADRIGIHHAMAFEATRDGTNKMWKKEKMARENFFERMYCSVNKERLPMKERMRKINKEKFFDL